MAWKSGASGLQRITSSRSRMPDSAAKSRNLNEKGHPSFRYAFGLKGAELMAIPGMKSSRCRWRAGRVPDRTGESRPAGSVHENGYGVRGDAIGHDHQ